MVQESKMLNKNRSKISGDGLPIAQVKLGIVCPMANEKRTATAFISEVLEQTKNRDFQSVRFFVVLDRISKDGTREILENMQKVEPQLQVVWSPENRCVVDAYIRGYQEAITAGCDWILEIDGGYSHQPADVHKFFNKMAEGYDCVFGSRFCEGGSMSESPMKRHIISRGGTIVTNALLGTKLKDMTSGFEMFSRPVLQEILDRGIHSRGHFFQTEIKTYCRGFKIAEVPITYRAASDSVNNTVIKDAFDNLWRLFRLRLAGKL